MLVSRHSDGRFIGDLLRRFGIGVVHGSTARRGEDRGGATGVRALLALLDAGDHVVITPDGPRGPRRVPAPGVAQISALSGIPVVPCAAQTTHRWTLPPGTAWSCHCPWAVARSSAAPRSRCRARTGPPRAGDRRGDQRGVRRGGPAVRLMLPVYAAATRLAAPALRLLLARRVRQGKEIAARLPERRGIDAAPRPPGRLIWLHAASVGETVSVLPVLGRSPHPASPC